jgi:hypothetical protein
MQAFPRRAWERERSRSHAPRGNACSDAPRPASVKSDENLQII